MIAAIRKTRLGWLGRPGQLAARRPGRPAGPHRSLNYKTITLKKCSNPRSRLPLTQEQKAVAIVQAVKCSNDVVFFGKR